MYTQTKKTNPVLVIFVMATLVQVQVLAHSYESDSLIKFHGYVLDTISDAPNAVPVKAKIILERLPYGNEIGILSSKDSTGYYKYQLSPIHDYKISITSGGHRPFEGVVKTKAWSNSGSIKRNYYLQPEWKQDQVIRLNKLIFEQGRSVISRESLGELNFLAKTMNENKEMVVQLEGHTDWRGDHKSNMTLSEERVNAVKNYLISMGINAKRIKTKAFGGTSPITRDDSLEASSINRRVEVRILKTE